MSKPVLIDFKDSKKEIQKYADEECDGNFNAAVRRLVKIALLNWE